MDIEAIRALANVSSPDFNQLAIVSHNAIEYGPTTATERAELLCYYVEAVMHLSPTRRRLKECTRLAQDAFTIAMQENALVVAARAGCLEVRVLGLRGATEETTKAALRGLERRLDAIGWRSSPGNNTDTKQILMLLGSTRGMTATQQYLRS